MGLYLERAKPKPEISKGLHSQLRNAWVDKKAGLEVELVENFLVTLLETMSFGPTVKWKVPIKCHQVPYDIILSISQTPVLYIGMNGIRLEEKIRVFMLRV
ncbi:hypothetical protein ACFX11_024911 [Malus domestica]